MIWLDGSIASAFMLASLYLLSRAVGCRAATSIALSVATIALPMVALFVIYTTPVSANLILALEFFAKLVLPIVLFALAMAVSKKVGSDV
ncbi:MAG: hypothetical protein AAF829_13975 [Pseudomonadota bacterium]